MKVNCEVSILSKENHDQLPESWSNEDFIKILDLLGFSDEVAEAEVQEMAMMAIADQEPEESAAILLQYRLSEKLTEGQIQQLSHEMQEDKTSEEYPDIFLQQEFFNINQLLFKSFNGRFPNCHATELNFKLKINPSNVMEDETLWNSMLIKALMPGLGEHSVIARLYEEELAGKKKFADADGIIWQSKLKKIEEGTFEVQVFSSEYWLDDLPSSGDYKTSIQLFDDEN